MAGSRPLLGWHPIHAFSCGCILSLYFAYGVGHCGLDARGSVNVGGSRPAPRHLSGTCAQGPPGWGSCRTSPGRVLAGAMCRRRCDVPSAHCRGPPRLKHCARSAIDNCLPGVGLGIQVCWLDFVGIVPHGWGRPMRLTAGRRSWCYPGLLGSPGRRWARRSSSWDPLIDSPICSAEAEGSSTPQHWIALGFKGLEVGQKAPARFLLARGEVLCKREGTPSKALAMLESGISCPCRVELHQDWPRPCSIGLELAEAVGVHNVGDQRWEIPVPPK